MSGFDYVRRYYGVPAKRGMRRRGELALNEGVVIVEGNEPIPFNLELEELGPA